MTYLSEDDPGLLGVGLTPAEVALLDCAPVVTHEPTWAQLHALGVRGRAITGRSPFAALTVEPVVYLGEARFEFARHLRDQSDAVLAVIGPVRDALGRTRDLIAWNPETNASASWRGAALLGEENINAPRLDGERLRVHATVLDWLLAGREGVVVLVAERARWLLAEEKLVVADVDFGDRLDAMLALPLPDIHVDNQERDAA